MTSTSRKVMQAVRTTGIPDSPLVLVRTPIPIPAPNQALVRVHAISLNAGELRRSRQAGPDEPIGWDFAGTVERRALDGTGPREGTRIVGFVARGAWADYVAAPVDRLAVLPHDVAFHDAATLPVAGLTALRSLRRGGDLHGKSVLVVPGTGGVGLFALQLAKRAGATITTVIRRAANEALVRGHGANTVVVGTTADAGRGTTYDLILESLGGASLAAAMGMLRPDGSVVSFGQTVAEMTTFAANAFYPIGGATLYGFILFHEADKTPVAADLAYLAGLVATNELATAINATLSFESIADAIALRSHRGFPGKIVVTLRD